ncbi:hypothetical protein EDD18DRAFT_1344652 [Armillaria luteobubalina]|uniref:Uncharacterized protein n=1 Tax=Armillaria luteobubalina TaxID=153913 RepID=A0AA39QLB2_9AGAR|nr:hypothetical protein EDD18DRAFT_1344652 [Armillaria luteobubalina]
MSKIIDLCEIQLCELALGGGGTRPREEKGILQRLDKLERNILRAVEERQPGGMNNQQRSPWKGPLIDVKMPPPPPPPLKDPLHHTVTLSLVKVMDATSLHELSPKMLTQKVQEAIHGCGMPGLETVDIPGVQVMAKARIKVYAKTNTEANALLDMSGAWLPKLAPGATLVLRMWNVAVNSVPTTFRPDNRDNLDSLFEWNLDINPATVRKVCWLNVKAASKPGKRASSLVLTISDYAIAE